MTAMLTPLFAGGAGWEVLNGPGVLVGLELLLGADSTLPLLALVSASRGLLVAAGASGEGPGAEAVVVVGTGDAGDGSDEGPGPGVALLMLDGLSKYLQTLDSSSKTTACGSVDHPSDMNEVTLVVGITDQARSHNEKPYVSNQINTL